MKAMTLQLNEVKVTYISTHITPERAKFINFCFRLILPLTPVNIYDALYNAHEDKMIYSALSSIRAEHFLKSNIFPTCHSPERKFSNITYQNFGLQN